MFSVCVYHKIWSCEKAPLSVWCCILWSHRAADECFRVLCCSQIDVWCLFLDSDGGAGGAENSAGFNSIKRAPFGSATWKTPAHNVTQLQPKRPHRPTHNSIRRSYSWSTDACVNHRDKGEVCSNKIMWKFLGSSSCLTSDLRPPLISTQKGFHSQTHRHIRDLVTSYCKNRHNHELASQETFICLTVCWWHRTWAEPQNNLTKHQQQQHVAKLTIQSSYLTQYQRCWNVCSCVSLNHSSRILLNWFSIEPAAMHSGIDQSVKDTRNAF